MHETYTTVVGNIATRVDLRNLQDGTVLASFRVATTERRRDRDTGSWRDGESLYLHVTCWRALAENVHRSLGVGDPVIIHGKLFTRSWEKDGKRQSAVEMEGHTVGPDLARSTAVVTRPSRAGGAGAVAAAGEPANGPQSGATAGGAGARPPDSAGAEAGWEPQPGAPHARGPATTGSGFPAARPAPLEAGVGA
ncbi:single-stranded DNA-binding protein [Pseudonocardia alaniniphila]|uniref:Single-stranded DNA-binding protein n=1 Tax=Pseudonocardia alaniniphila TaxID=75291 RepID=A0ABS9TPW0_9PSEU|nr:single-stranded DNA-binding protein [Pseudonocardia alaniniphila]MCH6170579.1 single-stranded DNA-binding protein [Pseudonocardia alaniniphila]